VHSRRFVTIVLAVAALVSVALAAGPAAAASPKVSLGTTTVGVTEGNSGTATATLTVKLDVASANTVTVAYATADGTAKLADNDYVTKSGTVTFNPGVTSQTITVQAVGDTKLEDYQIFNVKISAPTGGAVLGTANEKVQIRNDETPKLAMAPVKVAEGSPAAFKPKLTQAYYQPITLTAATSDGSAKTPGDYTAVNQSVTFTAGAKTASPVNVATIADGVTEGNETFNLQVSGGGVAAAVKKTATITSSLCQGATPPAQYQHVILVVMENKKYTDVIGNASAPWITNLAQSCATAKAYAQAGSPSRPNYIAMTAGNLFNCAGSNNDPGANDCTPSSPSLFKQVLDAGGTTLSYAEGMNGNCDLTSHGTYAVKHNPWPYFAAEASLCQQYNQPMPAALDVNNLPKLLTVFPDLCHDMHDCSVAAGNSWISSFLQPVFNSPAYLNGSTAVIVTWDEYTNLPNAFASTSVKPGTVVTAATSHYALLRTIEEMLGINTFLGQAATATSLRTAMHL
jgi:hypothetical protein